MAEVADEEIAQLQADRAALQQQKAELETLKARDQEGTQRFRQLEQRYAQDVGAVTAYAQQLEQRFAPQQPQEDPEVLENRKKVVAETVQAIQGNFLNPVVNEYYKSQRANARHMAKLDPEIKSFLDHPTYGKEIEAMLDAQPAGSALTVDAYALAARAVKGLHFDEILTERIAAQPKAKRQEGEEEEQADEGGEGEEPEPVSTRAPIATMPVSSRALGSAARTPKRKFAPLDATERAAARRARLTDEEFDRYSHAELSTDFLGFKGRERI
jgi:hypothetical protein